MMNNPGVVIIPKNRIRVILKAQLYFHAEAKPLLKIAVDAIIFILPNSMTTCRQG
jgi:hypothetical protein